MNGLEQASNHGLKGRILMSGPTEPCVTEVKRTPLGILLPPSSVSTVVSRPLIGTVEWKRRAASKSSVTCLGKESCRQLRTFFQDHVHIFEFIKIFPFGFSVTNHSVNFLLQFRNTLRVASQLIHRPAKRVRGSFVACFQDRSAKMHINCGHQHEPARKNIMTSSSTSDSLRGCSPSAWASINMSIRSLLCFGEDSSSSEFLAILFLILSTNALFTSARMTWAGSAMALVLKPSIFQNDLGITMRFSISLITITNI